MNVLGLQISIKDWKGFYIACLLFVLQFAYYQMQGLLMFYVENTPFLKSFLLSFPVNHWQIIVFSFDIVVHACFSVVIIYFLHKNRKSTMLVVYMSIILFLVFALLGITAKYSGNIVVGSIFVNTMRFLASPFKTIFSIPALMLKHDDAHTEPVIGEGVKN